MKSKVVIILLILIGSTYLCGCTNKNENQNKEQIKCDFLDIRWTRTTKSDTEYISFHSNKHFSYYCACGNPVNDSDLCENYTYDKKTQTIKIKCTQKTKETINQIKIKSCSENSIVLDIDGDIRKFVKDDEK